MEKLGASIGFQLIKIFNIIDDTTLSEQEKREKISEFQKGIQEIGTGIQIPKSERKGQNEKNGFYVFGDVDELSYEDLLKTKDYVDRYLSSFTCEGEMKMKTILRGFDKSTSSIIYNFEFADLVYNYAQSQGKDVRGHTLVWHTHFPSAIDQYIEDKLGMTMNEYEKQYSTEEFIARRKEITEQFLGEYIKTMGEHYPKCYCWDVLNEIVPRMEIPVGSNDEHCPTPAERADGVRHSKWYEHLGENYFLDVLKIARENLPEGTKLFYNEFGEQHPEKRKAIIEIIKKIKLYERDHQDELGIDSDGNQKTLLDGWGLQSHYNQQMTAEDIENIYSDISELQDWLKENNCKPLEIQVTEIDITPGRDEEGNPLPINPDKYAELWEKTFECAEKYGISAYTGWGVSDSLSWFRNIKCTMIDKHGNIKDFARPFIDRVSVKETTKKAIIDKTATEDVEKWDNIKSREKETEDPEPKF